MSNEAYDEFCKASIPDLTPLDRQLLGHYATRFNETVNPPRAWPPLLELKRITGAHPKSISRSLGRLCKRGLLPRVTLASKERGRKGEYAINRNLIRSHIQVTEELPNTKSEVTEEALIGNSKVLEGNSGVPVTPPSGYPKRIKPIKPTNEINHDRFDKLKLLLVRELQGLMAGANYEVSLNALDAKGIRLEDTARHLNEQNYTDARNIGGLVATILKTFADRPATLTGSDLFEWCGECKSKDDRTVVNRYEIKDGNGATTNSCPTCSRYAQTTLKSDDF